MSGYWSADNIEVMKIARRISTQEWINDFQKNATAEGLTANAVNAGIPLEDVEIVEVDEATFETIQESVIAPLRLIAEQEAELSRTQMLAVFNGLRQLWGLTPAQMKLFLRAVKQLDEEDV